MAEEWFGSWFDSPYYQLLYRHRDQHEASRFLEALLRFLKLPKGAALLDLACGRGRHSIVLQQKGYRVTGLDYSSGSIEDARIASAGLDNLVFTVHDMRNPFPSGGFDAVFNLFTSFGYFDTPRENQAVLENAFQALSPGGYFILDFLNPVVVTENLISESVQIEDGVVFNIARSIRNGRVIKEINILDQHKKLRFEEQVALIRYSELERMILDAGFTILTSWGNYDGESFAENTSPRMIFITVRPLT